MRKGAEVGPSAVDTETYVVDAEILPLSNVEGSVPWVIVELRLGKVCLMKHQSVRGPSQQYSFRWQRCY